MVPYEEKVNTFRELLERPAVQQQIAHSRRVAIDPATTTRMIMTTIQLDPKLLDCTPQSVLAAGITATQLGLVPDNTSGLAYLVPFKGKCVLIPGYRGFVQLMWRSGKINGLVVVNVYENEESLYDPSADKQVIHRPLAPSKRGAHVATWACVKLIEGGAVYEWMWAEEIEAIRKSAPGGNSKAWRESPSEMWRKTVIRRLFKWVPSSPEIQRAITLGDQADAGIPQNLDIVDVPAAASEPTGPPASLADHVEQEPAKAVGLNDVLEQMKEKPDKPAPKLEAKPPETAPGEVSQDLAAHRRDLAERIAALDHPSCKVANVR